MAAHILANLPKGYRSMKTIIQMEDNYLDDLEKVKKQVAKFWKTRYRNRSKKHYKSDSDSSSNSSSDSSVEADDKTRKRKGDKYALNTDAEKRDTYNKYGIVICGHCKKPGHAMVNCWVLHGRLTHMNDKNINGGRNTQAGAIKRCWNCGSTDHLAHNCPNKKDANNKENNNKEEDENTNNLFIGTMEHCKRNLEWRTKTRCNAFNIVNKKEEEDNIEMIDSDHNSWVEVTNDDISDSFNKERSVLWDNVDDSDNDYGYDTAINKWNKAAEEELKMILGMTNCYKAINEKMESNTTSKVDKAMTNDDKENNKRNNIKKNKGNQEEIKYCTINYIGVMTLETDSDDNEPGTSNTNEEENNDNASRQSVENENTIGNKESVLNSHNEGLGLAVASSNLMSENSETTKREDESLKYSDSYYNKDGILMKRKKVTKNEAVDLIAKYYGDKFATQEDSEAYKEWRKEQEKNGAIFTPQPWDDNYGHYDEDTDDSVEMQKRLKKRELFSKDQLETRLTLIN